MKKLLRNEWKGMLGLVFIVCFIKFLAYFSSIVNCMEANILLTRLMGWFKFKIFQFSHCMNWFLNPELKLLTHINFFK